MSQPPLLEPSRGPSGRHRARKLGGPAGAVTAGIAVTSLAVAGYAVSSSAAAPGTGGLTAAVSRLNPDLAADTAAERSARASYEAHAAFAEATALREQQALDSLGASADLTSSSVRSARGASDAIAEERAEKAAARRAAEEKAAAEAAAAEQAAEEAAAEEAAAQAAAERAEEQAASRSTPREEASVSTAPVVSGDSRSIARSMLGSYGWGDDQWGCLDSLWQRESGWNHLAMNASSGAYGIPQALPGSKMASVAGDWQTNPTTQITWGLGYISERYGSPCNAWGHSESVGWY
ncbi:lytic transglycosylase domain-containing protein [Ornithinimicrobium tianjinense]|uniref:Transglycosylase SLT domain-containing protein n=1 Tax=Ornithinimicrobium tianjinense TaxID=1195761 RepID=A0A917BDT0_9MICO|nr:lytic transglycosylase domain-containing protein [Ornithinimicrobium tianjinense]GGF39140.1 hypothetical protein GCM10011366_03450 [Ornithinimicrobium tianjinense]